MRKAESGRRFDEIVAFAEIERFLDTPVKRYSSGMYVRLAFAVDAHLEVGSCWWTGCWRWLRRV
jgi:lipopolysaccharide transport system ATP-binding protein